MQSDFDNGSYLNNEDEDNFGDLDFWMWISPNVQSEFDLSTKHNNTILDAAAAGEVSGVKTFIESKVCINFSDYDKRTALHLAASEGHFNLVSWLISNKADLNARDRWGNQPLKEAMCSGNSSIAALLTASGAVVSVEGCKDLSCKMCQMAAEGDLQRLRCLIECCASVNSSDYDQRTPLHLASAAGHSDIVSYLLAHGADHSLQDRWGRAAIDDAGRPSRVEDLLRAASALPLATVVSDSGPSHSLAADLCSPAPPAFQTRMTAPLEPTPGSDWEVVRTQRQPFSGDQTTAAPKLSVLRASLRLRAYCAAEVTVLFVDIKGFTASCAAVTAQKAGEWVAAFYELVDKAAAPLGVCKAEVRGDCCICVTGELSDAPCVKLQAGITSGDQVTRMLAFAAALHDSLATLVHPAGDEIPTRARMGLAFGEAAFLLDADQPPSGVLPPPPCWGQSCGGFVSVQGDVVNTAARMEAAAAPGIVLVHSSAARRWAAEAPQRINPRCCRLACKGKEAQQAARFDCALGSFCDDVEEARSEQPKSKTWSEDVAPGRTGMRRSNSFSG